MDRGLRIIVYRDDNLALVHTGSVLDSTADSNADNQLRPYGNSCLADLPCVLHESGVNSRAGSSNLGAESLGKVENQGEVLLAAHSVTAIDDYLGSKGAWANKFDKSQTRNEAFNGGSTVPMMHQQTTLTYGESDNCQMLSLPYGNGAYRMTVLLPREGSTVADVLEDLTADRWQRMPMADAEVDVKLPSFESNTDVTLNDIMSQLGMPKAFTDFAEFPDFCNVPTRIGLMKQVARIKVDEAGTEAAAVTVIGMVTTAISPEPRLVTFHATRPFLYVISERSTGAIFFIGQYNGK